MRFIVSINSSNAALADDPAAEVARILRTLAEQAEAVLDHVTAPETAGGPIGDINGNLVGRWGYVPEDSDDQHVLEDFGMTELP